VRQNKVVKITPIKQHVLAAWPAGNQFSALHISMQSHHRHPEILGSLRCVAVSFIHLNLHFDYFYFSSYKKTSALALSASLEVISASLLIIPIQAEALPERGYMLFESGDSF
jgi:hypothetical protein